MPPGAVAEFEGWGRPRGGKRGLGAEIRPRGPRKNAPNSPFPPSPRARGRNRGLGATLWRKRGVGGGNPPARRAEKRPQPPIPAMPLGAVAEFEGWGRKSARSPPRTAFHAKRGAPPPVGEGARNRPSSRRPFARNRPSSRRPFARNRPSSRRPFAWPGRDLQRAQRFDCKKVNKPVAHRLRCAKVQNMQTLRENIGFIRSDRTSPSLRNDVFSIYYYRYL